ncbi:MAG: YraN family protein [Ferruginibacter sp.]
MGSKQLTGQYGEELAVGFLRESGYEILHKNWRCGHWEIDLIATKNTVLYFFEIKTSRTNDHGYPEDRVDRKKITYMTCAAEEYLIGYPLWKRIQFNILSVTLEPSTTFFLIEDVYL